VSDTVIEVRDLKTHFFTRAGVLPAVDGVSFSVRRGEVLGIVGESGSGKSVTGLSILGLVDAPGRIVGGEIMFGGRNWPACRSGTARHPRAPDRDDLPGPDDDAQPGAARLDPDDRGGAGA
jgi:ABC-type dipeptide/oligopeptide/nickel transport system ATPase component